MKIRYSRFRTLLFTIAFGLAIVNICARLSEYLEEIPVNLPKVESETPIIIRLCPKLLLHKKGYFYYEKFYQENGYSYFNKEKAINCNVGGGGGGGAAE